MISFDILTLYIALLTYIEDVSAEVGRCTLTMTHVLVVDTGFVSFKEFTSR